MKIAILFALVFLVILVFFLLNITPFFTLIEYDALSMSDVSALGSLVAGLGSLVAVIGLYFSISQQNKILAIQRKELSEASLQTKMSELTHFMTTLNPRYLDEAVDRLNKKSLQLWDDFKGLAGCNEEFKPDPYSNGTDCSYLSIIVRFDVNLSKTIEGEIELLHERVRVHEFIDLHYQLFGILETINSISHLTKRIAEIYTELGRQSDFRGWAQSRQIYLDEDLVDIIFKTAERLEKWFVDSKIDFDVEKSSFAEKFKGERPFTGIRCDVP